MEASGLWSEERAQVRWTRIPEVWNLSSLNNYLSGNNVVLHGCFLEGLITAIRPSQRQPVVHRQRVLSPGLRICIDHLLPTLREGALGWPPLIKEEGSRHSKGCLCPELHIGSVARDSQPRSSPHYLLSTFLLHWWSLCICFFHTETFPPYKAHAQLTRLRKLTELTRFARLFPKDKEETTSGETRLIDRLYRKTVQRGSFKCPHPLWGLGFSVQSLPFSQSWSNRKPLTNTPLSKIDLAITKWHLSSVFSLLYYWSLLE